MTFHLTNISVTGEKSEQHLCEKCAIEEGLMQVHKPEASSELLASFIKGQKGQHLAQIVCPECGISFLEFRNQGLLGCPHDYKAFREYLMPLIERAHDGAEHHTGKTPRSHGSAAASRGELRKLKRQLEEAIAAEDYERAAELRDRIRTMESA